MTKLEKQALQRIIRDAKFIAITTATMEPNTDGKLVYRQVTSSAEATRLRESADFRKGWEMCWANFVLNLDVLNSDSKHIKRYLGL